MCMCMCMTCTVLRHLGLNDFLIPHVLKRYDREKERGDLRRWLVFGLWRLRKCRNTMVFEKKTVHPHGCNNDVTTTLGGV